MLNLDLEKRMQENCAFVSAGPPWRSDIWQHRNLVLAVLYDRYRESAVETGEQIKTVREWLIWNADECAKDVEWHLTVPAA